MAYDPVFIYYDNNIITHHEANSKQTVENENQRHCQICNLKMRENLVRYEIHRNIEYFANYDLSTTMVKIPVYVKDFGAL